MVKGTVDQFPRTAFKFRDDAERLGIVDKYHYGKDKSPNGERHPRSFWENDDCGMTLGYLGDAPAGIIAAVVTEVREMLSDPRKRLDVTLSGEDFAFVKYRDTGLAQVEAIIPAPEITGPGWRLSMPTSAGEGGPWVEGPTPRAEVCR